MDVAEASADDPAGAGVPTPTEWRGRPLLGALLRWAILGLPMLASLGASTLLTHLLPFPTQTSHVVVWLAGITLVAAAVFFGLQRLLRRLLPLATLLSLTMIFPDRAPARFAVARQAGRVRDLEAAVARGESLGDSPGGAAATVLALVTALTSHDKGTRGHSERTRVFTDMLAAELGLSKQEQGKLRWAALLHDIGKLKVSPAILNKPGKPDAGEWESIKAHPEQGARMIAPLVAWLGPWAQAVDHHHEKYNGTGYPRGLVGKQISLAGRIVAVADAYETMTAPRPYKKSMSVSAARKELVRSSGSHFDPVVVRAFLNISVGRLRRAVGLAAWVGQVPAGLRILQGTARIGAAGQAATAAVATAGIIAGVAAGPHLPGVQASAAAPDPQSLPSALSPSPLLSGRSAAPGAAPAPTRTPTGAVGSTRPPASGPSPGEGPISTSGPAAPNPAVPPSGSPGAPSATGSSSPPSPPSAPANRAPTVAMPGPITAGEGAALTASGSFADPDSTAWTATVDYGDGGGVQVLPLNGSTFTLTHAYAAEGSPTITVRVRDDAGAVGVGTVRNQVTDVRLQVAPLANPTLLLTNVYSAPGSFQDPGADSSDSYSATVNYDSTNPSSPVQNLVLVGNTFTLQHNYPILLPRTYTVTVTVIDNGGLAGVATARVTAT